MSKETEQLEQYQKADSLIRRDAELLGMLAKGWKRLDESIPALERMSKGLWKEDKEEKFTSFDMYCRKRIGICGEYARKLISHWHFTEGFPELRALGESKTRAFREGKVTAQEMIDSIESMPISEIPADALRKLARRKMNLFKNNTRLGNLPDPNPNRVSHSDDFKIYFKDSLELLGSLKVKGRKKPIDLIFSDPDWTDQDNINAFIKLASKKSKILALMAGNENADATKDCMRKHFPIVREIHYALPGAGNKIVDLNISTVWKPVFVGSFNYDRGFLNSVISEKESHDLHPWGLNQEAVERIIEYLSDPGDLVGDFYLGSGCTALACVQTGRRFIGGDNGLVAKGFIKGAPPDQTWAEVAIDRVNKELAKDLKKVA